MPKSNILRICVLFVLAVGAAIPLAATAQPGDIDVAFGSAGDVSVDLPAGVDVARIPVNGLAAQQVARSVALVPADPFDVLVGVTSDGLVNEFGEAGIVPLVDHSGAALRASALRIDEMDRIWVVGSAGETWFVARFTANGDPDQAFGVHGLIKGGEMSGVVAQTLFVEPEGGAVVVLAPVSQAAVSLPIQFVRVDQAGIQVDGDSSTVQSPSWPSSGGSTLLTALQITAFAPVGDGGFVLDGWMESDEGRDRFAMAVDSEFTVDETYRDNGPLHRARSAISEVVEVQDGSAYVFGDGKFVYGRAVDEPLRGTVVAIEASGVDEGFGSGGVAQGPMGAPLGAYTTTDDHIVVASIAGGNLHLRRLLARDVAPILPASLASLSFASVYPSTFVPSITSENDGAPVEVGVKFRVDVPGVVHGVRFFKGPGNSGPHMGNLWSADGVRLASATFSDETTTGWQQVLFTEPIAVEAGAMYVASYHAPNGHYAYEAGGLVNTVGESPLVLPKSSAVGGNGVYAYGISSRFPDHSYDSSNYFVDVLFAPGAPVPPMPLPNGAQTIFTSSQAPETPSDPDGTAVELGVRFASDVEGGVHGVRFYKGSADNSGPHVGSLWDPTGAQLATARFGSTTDSGWQTVLFDEPVAIHAGDIYTASYFAPNGHYAATVGGLTRPLKSRHLYTPAEANGVYRYNGGFPASTFSGTNYFVDVVFVPTQSLPLEESDTTERVAEDVEGVFAPDRVIVDPDAGTNVPSELGLRFVSSRDGYVRGVRFYKSQNNIGPHTGSLWREDGTRLATATFANETATGWQNVMFNQPVHVRAGEVFVVSYFAPSGHYARVVGTLSTAVARGPLTALGTADGGNGVFAPSFEGTFPTTDSGGDDFGVDVLFSLPLEGGSIHDRGSDVPQHAVSDSDAVEVGTKFQVSRDSMATHLRFNKGLGNTGTHVGSLWTDTGALLGRVTFMNETAMGWQTAALSSPVALQRGTTYVVSYHAPNGHYSFAPFGLASDVGGPLVVAPASDRIGGNGVFRYSSTPAFPQGSWQSGDYFVDVVVDTDAPQSIGGHAPTAPSGIVVSYAAELSATWVPAIDVDGDVERHEYCVSRSNDCSSGIVRRWTQSELATGTRARNLELPDGVFFVCVRARDAAGNTSPVACSAGIGVGDAAPGVPVDLAPRGGVEVVTGAVTLSWRGSNNDGAAMTAGYEYRIALAGAIEAQPWSATTATNVATMLPVGSYEWHVRALDAAGRRSAIAGAAFVVVESASVAPSNVVDGGGPDDLDWLDPEVDMRAAWTAPSSPGVDSQQWCLTAFEVCDDGSVVPWSDIARDAESVVLPYSPTLMPFGVPLRFCVRARLGTTTSTAVCTDGQLHDSRPPTMYSVREVGPSGAGEQDWARTSDTIEIAWEPATVDYTPIASYAWLVCAFTDASCSNPAVSGVLSGTAAAVDLGAVQPGRRYRTCVVAIDTRGRSSQRACSDGFVALDAFPAVSQVSVALEDELRYVDIDATVAWQLTFSGLIQSGFPVEWQLCRGSSCDQLGAVVVRAGTTSTGSVAVADAFVAGQQYWMCAMSAGTAMRCAQPIVAVAPPATYQGKEVIDYEEFLPLSGADFDTIRAGADLVSWTFEVPGAAYRWQLCTDASCSSIVSTRFSTTNTRAFSHTLLTMGSTYYVCVAAFAPDTGAQIGMSGCSDGALVRPASSGTMVNGLSFAFGQREIVWTPERSPYIVTNNVVVGGLSGLPQVLRIAPGTVVKVQGSNVGITVHPTGRLDARGAIITSIKDDTVGGDSDGVTATPQSGSWTGIVLRSNGNFIADSEIRYAGVGIQVLGSNNTITRTKILDTLIAASVEAHGALLSRLRVIGAIWGVRVEPTGSAWILGSFFDRIKNNPVYVHAASGGQPSVVEGNDLRNPLGNGIIAGRSFRGGLFGLNLTHADRGMPILNANLFAPLNRSVEVEGYLERQGWPQWGSNNWGQSGQRQYCYGFRAFTGAFTYLYVDEVMQSIQPPEVHNNGTAAVPTLGKAVLDQEPGCPPNPDPEVLYWFGEGEDPFPTGEAGGGSRAGSAPAGPQAGPCRGHCADPTGTQADPVTSLNGNFFFTRTDASLQTPGLDFKFGRTYNSTSTIDGILGRGWTTELDVRLALVGNLAWFTEEGGRSVEFVKDASGWTGREGVWSRLYESDAGFTLVMRNGDRYGFDADGALLGRHDRFGNGYTVDREGSAHTIRVVASSGRVATLEMSDDDLRLDSLRLDDGRVVEYIYDEDYRLVRVEGITDAQWSYSYDANARVLCEVDPGGRLVFENRYTSTGRLLEQWDGSRGACSAMAPDNVVAHAPSTTWDTSDGALPFDVRATDPAGAVWTDRYDVRGRLVARIDPTGRCTSYDYDDNGNRTLEIASTGGAIRTAFDSQGRPLTQRVDSVRMSDPWTCDGPRPAASPGAVRPTLEHWSYEGSYGDVALHEIAVIDESGEPRVRTRDVFEWSAGSLASATTLADGDLADHPSVDAESVSQSFTHDELGRMVTRTDERGKTTEYSYDRDGHVTSVTPPGRGATTYEYDDHGFLSAVVEPRGSGIDRHRYATRYVNDAAGRVLERRDAYGSTSTSQYDASGHLVRERDAAGRETIYTYNAFGELVRAERPGGVVDGIEYDVRGLVRAVVHSGRRTQYAYDQAGRRVAAIAPRGFAAGASPADFTTTTHYDAAGRIESVTMPRAHRVEYVRDDLDRIVRSTSFVGSTPIETTLHEFDDLSGTTTHTRRAASSTSGGYVSVERHDRLGRIAERVDERGGTWRSTFDDAGNVVRSVTPEGRVTRYGYADDGLLDAIVAPRGSEDADHATAYTTRLTRDAGSGLLTGIEGPGGRSVSYALDRVGRVIASTNAEGETIGTAFDRVGRITRVTSPMGAVTRYAYDDDHRAVVQTNPRGADTTFEFDVHGDLASKQLPSGRRWNYTRNAHGMVSSVVDPAGGTVGVAYDALDRVVGIDYSDPDTSDVAWTFDDDTRSVVMADGRGVETRSFDSFGRTVGVSRGGRPALSYSWGADDLPVGMSIGGGSETVREFDADGLLTKVQIGPRVARFVHDPDGNVVTTTRQATSGDVTGVVEHRAYDAAGAVSSLTRELGGERLSREDVSRDRVGRVLRVMGEGGSESAFTYDPAGRLLAECHVVSCSADAGGDWTRYAYDEASNRVRRETGTGVGTSYSYNLDDQLVSTRADGANAVTLSYNARGEMTDSGTQRRWFDQAGRVTGQASSGAASPTTSYAISGTGQRIGITDGAGTRALLWDDATTSVPELVAEADASGTVANEYAHGPFGPLTARTGAAWADLLAGSVTNNITATASPTGVVTTTTTYDAWGASTTTGPPPPFTYTGQTPNPDSSIHLRARDYDPSLGVFTSPDPVERSVMSPFNGTYNYAEGVPTLYTDPMGTCVFCNIGAGIGDAIGGVVGGTWDAAQAGYDRYGGGWRGAFGAADALNPLGYGLRESYTSTSATCGGDWMCGAAGAIDYLNPAAGVRDAGGMCLGSTRSHDARKVSGQCTGLAMAILPSRYLPDGPGTYAPTRPLPRTRHGDPIPDSPYPHTQLGQRDDGNGPYNQARQWEINPVTGRLEPTRDIDFSDHGHPGTHPLPHQHPLTPNNPNTVPGGGVQRGDPEVFVPGWQRWPS